MAIGRNSGSKSNSVPISEMCHFVLDAVLAPFAIAFEHFTKLFNSNICHIKDTGSRCP